MNTTISKQIGLVLVYTTAISNTALLISDFNFTWFSIACAIVLFNVICGTMGATLIYTKFFKRKMDLENFGVWTAIVFAGPVVLIFSLVHKPRSPYYYLNH